MPSATTGTDTRDAPEHAHAASQPEDGRLDLHDVAGVLDFALRCGYLDLNDHTELSAEYEQIGKLLGSMIAAPEKFCYKERKVVS